MDVRRSREQRAQAAGEGVRGACEERQSERFLDRCEHPVVIDRGALTRSPTDVGADEDRRYVTTLRRIPATARIGAALIPGDEEKSVRPKGANQRRCGPREELVTAAHSTVMAVVAEIG